MWQDIPIGSSMKLRELTIFSRGELGNGDRQRAHAIIMLNSIFGQTPQNLVGDDDQMIRMRDGYCQ